MFTRPMKAATATSLSEVRLPVAATPKLDGIRALTRDGCMLSTSFKPLPNAALQQLAAALPAGLDGELVTTTFNDTQSVVMSRDGDISTLRYVVFDQWGVEPYWHRAHTLPDLPAWCDKLLPVALRSAQELEVFENNCVAVGYEGVILRDATAPYICKRSTLREHYMVKHKRFADRESRVVGFLEGYTNDNELTQDVFGYAKRSGHSAGKTPRGTLGSLLLADGTRVGSGMDDAMRAEVWNNKSAYLGRLVKYKYQHAAGYAPRFPAFVSFMEEQT